MTGVVLIAEADAAARQALSAVLQGAGFEVIQAADGAELANWIRRVFERRIESRAIELIICDQWLPAATGIDVLARLRRASWSTPFILLTGLEDASTRAEARRLGAAMVVDKPFDIGALCSAALQLTWPLT